jgi:hypothetical protein
MAINDWAADQQRVCMCIVGSITVLLNVLHAIRILYYKMETRWNLLFTATFGAMGRQQLEGMGRRPETSHVRGNGLLVCFAIPPPPFQL